MATIYSLICFGGRAGKTVTFTDAGDIANLTNHGLRNGTGVVLSTTGALPTGLVAGTTYYARQGADANKFTLHASQADAIAGTAQVTFTGIGSGTHTVRGAYFMALTSDQKARYGTVGAERIYDSMTAFVAGRAGASAYDTEVCEIGEAFNDIVTAMVQLAVPCAALIVTTMANGARSAAWHGGVPGNGYIVKRNPANASTIVNIETYDCTVDGFSVMAEGAATANMTGMEIEASLTLQQAMRVQLAALAGTTSGIGSATEKYYAMDGTTARITATFDGSSNRSTIELNGN